MTAPGRPGRAALLAVGAASLTVGAALALSGCATASGGGGPPAATGPTAPPLTSVSSPVSPTTPVTPVSPPTPTAAATPVGARPPYIARVAWSSDPQGRILRVYPTPAGRIAALSGSTEAWSEVLRYAADAGTPGMRAQFDCHWTFARIALPDKSSWNLEPWRPVVSQNEMQRTRCNPGGAEETVSR